MLPLRDLQGAMASSVLRGMDAPLAPIVRTDGIGFDGRLQVYRNNTFSSLTAALKDSFPVVCQLVDERFFGYAAQEYIRTNPPATSASSSPASSRSATSPTCRTWRGWNGPSTPPITRRTRRPSIRRASRPCRRTATPC